MEYIHYITNGKVIEDKVQGANLTYFTTDNKFHYYSGTNLPLNMFDGTDDNTTEIPEGLYYLGADLLFHQDTECVGIDCVCDN